MFYEKEDLFEGFGALDDALLERSEKDGGQKHYGAKRWQKVGCVAACFVILFMAVGAFLKNSNILPNSDTGIGNSDESSNETYVDVTKLLASNMGFTEESLQLTILDIGEYSACYEKVNSVRSIVLKASMGSEVDGTQNWYRVSGHEDMQYLILEKEDEYSLWEFYAFQSENYSYKDVLQIIYHINSVEDIEKIIVTPANMDNTDAGIELQNQIGTRTITDEESIKEIYDVLTGLTCYGEDNWEMIGLEAALLHIEKSTYLR